MPLETRRRSVLVCGRAVPSLGGSRTRTQTGVGGASGSAGICACVESRGVVCGTGRGSASGVAGTFILSAVARVRLFEKKMPFKRRHTEDGSEASECHSEDDFAAAALCDGMAPVWDDDGLLRPPKIR